MDKSSLKSYVYSPSGRSINARMNEAHLRATQFAPLVDILLNATEAFSDLTFTERLRMWIFEQVRDNHCDSCGIELRIWEGYNWKRFCSKKCAQAHPDTKNKIKTGLSAVDWSQTIKKRELTMQERYGISAASQSDEMKDALSKRNREAWADPIERQSRVNRRKETNLDRYGVEHNLDVPGKRSDAVSKAKVTRSKRTKEQKEITADLYRKAVVNPRAFEIITSRDAMFDLYVNQKISTLEISNEYQVHKDAILNAMRRFNIPLDIAREQNNQRSAKETAMFRWIQTLEPTAIQGSRIGRKQMDILIPDKKIIIEFNGVYWHSELKVMATDHHQKKHDFFVSLGYRYIQIWEDDWDLRKITVQMFLTNLLGHGTRIGARRTGIKSMTQTEFDAFVDLHHMQGTVRVGIRYGLYHQGKCLAAMGFTKEGSGYVLSRYANSNVSGAFAKLLKHFLKHNQTTKIKTFGDLEIIDQFNNVYLKNGFVEDHRIPPDYRYYSGQSGLREHKFKWRKSRFESLGLDIDGKTERELASECGLLRCWDSGKICYILNL